MQWRSQVFFGGERTSHANFRDKNSLNRIGDYKFPSIAPSSGYVPVPLVMLIIPRNRLLKQSEK